MAVHLSITPQATSHLVHKGHELIGSPDTILRTETPGRRPWTRRPILCEAVPDDIFNAAYTRRPLKLHCEASLGRGLESKIPEHLAKGGPFSDRLACRAI
jgi:hypothetical protein